MVFPDFSKTFLLKNKVFGVVKDEKYFLVFENLGKLSWIMELEIIWNIHRKSLRQKGIDLLTSARGKFGLRKMAEKIKSCDRRRIDRGHNVVCDVGSNVAILEIGLRSGDVASSYSGSIDSSSSNVDSSSSNIFTNNVRSFGQKWV